MYPLSGAVLLSGPYPEHLLLLLLIIVVPPLVLVALVVLLVHLVRTFRGGREEGGPSEGGAAG